MLEALKKGSAPSANAAFLGVSTQTLTPEIRRQSGFSAASGAIVVDVVAGSPADSAGLLQNDVITSIGGKAVTSAEDLVTAVRSHRAGDKVELDLRRGTADRKVSVTLGARPTSTG